MVLLPTIQTDSQILVHLGRDDTSKTLLLHVASHNFRSTQPTHYPRLKGFFVAQSQVLQNLV